MQGARHLPGSCLTKLVSCSIESHFLAFVGHFRGLLLGLHMKPGVCFLQGDTQIPYLSGGSCRPIPSYNDGLLTLPLKSSATSSVPLNSQGRCQSSDHTSFTAGIFISCSLVTLLEHTLPQVWVDGYQICFPIIPSYQKIPLSPLDPAFYTFGPCCLWCLCVSSGLEAALSVMLYYLHSGQWLGLSGQTGLVLRPQGSSLRCLNFRFLD